jgi:hypothetical protein
LQLARVAPADSHAATRLEISLVVHAPTCWETGTNGGISLLGTEVAGLEHVPCPPPLLLPLPELLPLPLPEPLLPPLPEPLPPPLPELLLPLAPPEPDPLLEPEAPSEMLASVPFSGAPPGLFPLQPEGDATMTGTARIIVATRNCDTPTREVYAVLVAHRA